jgi:hypothetical protein
MAGDRDGARAVVEARVLDPHAGGMASLAHVFVAALFGDEVTVDRLMTPEFEGVMWDDFQYGHAVAQCYCLLGRHEDARRWLERAVDRGFIHYRFLGDVDPLLAPLRKDERFRALMVRAKRAAEAFPWKTGA